MLQSISNYETLEMNRGINVVNFLNTCASKIFVSKLNIEQKMAMFRCLQMSATFLAFFVITAGLFFEQVKLDRRKCSTVFTKIFKKLESLVGIFFTQFSGKFFFELIGGKEWGDMTYPSYKTDSLAGYIVFEETVAHGLLLFQPPRVQIFT